VAQDAPDDRALLKHAQNLSGLLTSDSILEYLCRAARQLSGARVAFGSWLRVGEPWARGVHLAVGDDCRAAPPPMVSAGFATFRRLSSSSEPLCLLPSEALGAIFRGFGGADAAGAALWAIPLLNGRRRLIGQVVLLVVGDTSAQPSWMPRLSDLVSLASLAFESAQRLAFARRDQERLLLLAAATDEVLWDWDLQSNAFWWSGSVQNLIRSSSEFIGSTAGSKLERIHAEDVDAVRASITLALEGSELTWRAQYRFHRGDGSWAVVDDRGYFLRDAAGRAYRMLGAIRDVSAEAWFERQQAFLVQASAELAASLEVETNLESVAKLAVTTIADCSAVVLYGTDGGSAPVLAVGHRDAARAASLLASLGSIVAEERRTLEELIAAPVVHQATPENTAALCQRLPALRPVLELVEPGSLLLVPLGAAGAVIGCIALVLSRSSTASYSGSDLGFAEELARRCSVAIEKARLYEQAQNSIRSRDAFMAILGHELRNPLAPITTALHLMKLRDPRGQREQEVIARQVKHLTRLVDDLLDISRIERGKIELSRKPMQLAEIVAKAVEMTSPLLEQRRHRLDIDVPAAGLPLMADETRMAQVVANLLTNAARYTNEGGCIWIRAVRDGKDLVLSVRDNGIGMTPELLPRVFDLFTQGPRTIDRSQGGLGLGLSLVRSFVTLHGGSVEARSEGVNKGSELIVRLPSMLMELVPRVASPALPEERPRLAGRRILLVDDNADAAELLSEMLCASGHEVAVALDGPSALALAAGFNPDVAILDIGLPVMDGYELASRLSQLLTPRPLLVALTGYAQERDRRRAREAGFDEHITKPVDPEHLLRLVERQGAAARSTAP
jgi:signal transduction histidine kinase/CheY-like chemotaxis protein/PAS domain-containing protein